LVRYNHDGSIHYLGRKDGQVKIRGQRAELGEVEHPVISDLRDNSAVDPRWRQGSAETR
jgi:acyl-coenzyme A synthetase/AMP-(fatty) acid ligase